MSAPTTTTTTTTTNRRPSNVGATAIPINAPTSASASAGVSSDGRRSNTSNNNNIPPTATTTTTASPSTNTNTNIKYSDEDEAAELGSIHSHSSEGEKNAVGSGSNIKSRNAPNAIRLASFSLGSEPGTPMGSQSVISGKAGSSVRGSAVGGRYGIPGANASSTNASAKIAKVRREGSRLVLADEQIQEKEAAGDLDLDNPVAEAIVKFLTSYIPWALHADDNAIEREKRVVFLTHNAFTSLLCGFPLMIVFAMNVAEASDGSATRIITFVCFILLTIVPWIFWIAVNIHHDREFAEICQREKDRLRKEKVASNTAGLIEAAFARSNSIHGVNINNSFSGGAAAAAAAARSSSQKGISVPPTPSVHSENQQHQQQQQQQQKSATTADANVASAKPTITAATTAAATSPHRPPISPYVIDALTIILLILTIVVGICWRGISLVMLLLLLQIFARSSRSADPFVTSKVEAPMILGGGLYLFVKGVQESGLLSPDGNITAGSAFFVLPSSKEGIVAVVVGAIQFALFIFYIVTGNQINLMNQKHLKEYAEKQLKDKESALTRAEQHVAGGIVAALVRVDAAAAKKIAEKYINSASPGLLRGLSQLCTNMETYLNFVPTWVKNPSALEEEERKAAEAEEEEQQLQQDSDLNQSTETWTHSHSNINLLNNNNNNNDSRYSFFGKGGMAAAAALTKENMQQMEKGAAAGTTGEGVFGEYNLEYESDNDDITSVRDGGNTNNNNNNNNNFNLNQNKDGGNDFVKGVGAGAGAGAGFSGKVVLASLQFSLDFKKYSKAKFAQVLSQKNPIASNQADAAAVAIAALPNAVPVSAPPLPPSSSAVTPGGVGVGGDEQPQHQQQQIPVDQDHTQTDVEKVIVDKICELCANTGGILHSVVANRVIVSWNTMSRTAAPEHKAVRFLVTCRKLATDKDSLFPGLSVTGACMTGHGRALISSAGSSLTSVVCVRWHRELELLAILAAQENTLLCDLATKHAVFLEFSVRGYGCLGSKNKIAQQGQNFTPKSHALATTAAAGAGARTGASPRMSNLARQKSSDMNNVNNNNNNNSQDVLARQGSSMKRSTSGLLPSGGAAAGGGGAGAGDGPTSNEQNSQQQQQQPPPPVTAQQQKSFEPQQQQQQQGPDFLAVFSIIGRRTGNNVEWMYLLQGGDEESGAADPGAVSCSAMDHAAAGNFLTAKKYVDQAIRLCEREAIDLAKKVKEMQLTQAAAAAQAGNSFSQRQKDEYDNLEDQVEINRQSHVMFKQLSKRLENATIENFPYRLVVQ